MRATGSTIISQVLDSFVVSYLAFSLGKSLTGQTPATFSEILSIASTGILSYIWTLKLNRMTYYIIYFTHKNIIFYFILFFYFFIFLFFIFIFFEYFSVLIFLIYKFFRIWIEILFGRLNDTGIIFSKECSIVLFWATTTTCWRR